MRDNEAENGGQHGRVVHTAPQIIGGEAGERQQPIGPCRLRKRPAQRCQRQRESILTARFTYFPDCHEPYKRYLNPVKPS